MYGGNTGPSKPEKKYKKCFWCQPNTNQDTHDTEDRPRFVDRCSSIETNYTHIDPNAGTRLGPRLPVIC